MYVSECDVCQRIKADHLKPAGMLQPLEVPFGNGKTYTWTSLWAYLPHEKGYDSIGKTICRVIYLSNCGTTRCSSTITSDRGSLFVSRFWEHLQTALGTTFIHSSAYHPQTGGQVERANQILEDMLRACALTYSTKWDECLPLASLLITTATRRA
ncbi:hypothetical protein U9M48_003328 [Paspalum notatum var. saurae]|uniref:Integrase catalytic domain-containing protein n=1 Tax=Paspalum notatum var. saurae TaxID=547442 RepID=A0AAQ3SI42_PASNO